jgi:RHH-type proline utilization regulon transcriptional repressor/proline dehydrogenase/delta 1-pyrroline-5-carboxylate dehydrogenase
VIVDLDAEVASLARRIAALGEGSAGVFRSGWWNDRMLQWAMSHPSFKTQLFRFVDVFPATTSDADVVRHLQEYFEGADVPKVLDVGLDLSEHLPGGRAVTASVARRNITRLAHQFIAGATAKDAVRELHALWRAGSAFTVDLLGEKTVTESEADAYAARVEEMLRVTADASAHWAPDDHLERDDIGPLPRVNVSVKPTALAPSYAPLTRNDGIGQAAARLRPILRLARRLGCFVYLDMEHYDVKDLTLELFRVLVDEDPSMDAGIVIQAYVRDSYDDLEALIAWAPAPITVRLVKGAYWDSETVVARAEGWPVPVFERKAETDANFERCVRVLHDNHGRVRAAFGSHNLRSLAYAVAYARTIGVPDHGYELQMLYGMAEPIQAAIRRLGLRLRVYAPVGDLLPGMAYLVRRLLENTSNESFVRRRFAEQEDLEALVAPVPVDLWPPPERPKERTTADPYEPEPAAEWRRAPVRAAFGSAIGRFCPADVAASIGGRDVRTHDEIVSLDPGALTIVARAARCGTDEADRAVDAATKAWDTWRRTPWHDRAAVLFRAAAWMRGRRDDLAAMEVFEAGKPWKEADADVCEAIDFCEYYGREAIRLAEGGRVQSPPGEHNVMRYQPKGIGVVIAPWNFPLAIPTGMVTAALVTGNCVLFKPAEQTPLVARQLADALRAGGLPDGALAFLPGVGEEIGAYLVSHPAVAFVAFTGSKAVGLSIVKAAAEVAPGQRHVKRVVAEMGSKNALLIDADADLDQAVPAIAYSAFGYAGQKCSAASRLVVVESVFDQTLERLAGYTRTLRIGHPRDMGVTVGPLIDQDAHRRVLEYAAMGETVLRRQDVPSTGYFAGPAIVTGVSTSSKLARDEIFGPVLTVFPAPDFERALAIANDTDYALTAGVFSRSPHHIRLAADELRAGNVYVNRAITGAVVGRQPFGGYGMSGVGSKAGGPDYLLQFCDPRVVTENTMRQGFAPE